VPRPVEGHGLLFVSTGYAPAELWALRPGGSGDISGTHVAWKLKAGAPLKPSVLLVGDRIYMVSDSGIARAVAATTGESVWQERIGTACSASPIFAAGRVYCSTEDGRTSVIEPGDNPRIVARNSLDGRILASPAVSGRALFVRTDTHLYRIEK
jgi:outer membrane protein assembly factor BamB